jgi:hypothetical protein
MSDYKGYSSNNIGKDMKSMVGKSNGSSGSRGVSFAGYAYNMFNSIKNLPSYIKSISDIGIDFSLIGSKNKIGVSKEETDDDDDYGVYNTLAAQYGVDTEVKTKDTPYFTKKYKDRIKYLNTFSTHPEIEFITNQICDEMIVYDEHGMFCKLDLSESKFNDETKKKIERDFRKIYSLLNFDDGITAWALALQWIIEGYLAFEIFYNDLENPSRITGFQELDAATLIPLIVEQEFEQEDGKVSKRKVKIWKQMATMANGSIIEKTLQDNQVLFIAFNRIPGQKGRISYVERLVRSFNLMRTMENTKVAWNVMNSQFRLKMVVPVGTKTTAKAKQALANITNKHKEDLMIDNDSGEVAINGQARINYGRNIVLPSRNGQSPDVDGVAYNGPDLSNMEGVKYFERKLWRDSTLPFSRFDKDGGGGTNVLFAAEGIPHDELTYHKLISRFRKEFERILKEALYRQVILTNPELKLDLSLKSKLGIVYESNSLIEEAKQQEITDAKIRSVQTMERLTEIDGRTPLYSKKFLYVNKYKIMDENEWEENIKMRDEELSDSNKRTKESENKDLSF